MSLSRAFWSQQIAQTKGFILQRIAALAKFIALPKALWPRILIYINWVSTPKFQKSQSLELLRSATPISCNADFLFSLDGFEVRWMCSSFKACKFEVQICVQQDKDYNMQFFYRGASWHICIMIITRSVPKHFEFKTKTQVESVKSMYCEWYVR